MKEGIEEIVLRLEAISQDSRIVELKIIEKTKSIVKARLYFSEDVFIQMYVNIRGHKNSYTLVLNDSRIFGKILFLENGIHTLLKHLMNMTFLENQESLIL